MKNKINLFSFGLLVAVALLFNSCRKESDLEKIDDEMSSLELGALRACKIPSNLKEVADKYALDPSVMTFKDSKNRKLLGAAMIELSKGTDCENNLRLAYEAANIVLKEIGRPTLENSNLTQMIGWGSPVDQDFSETITLEDVSVEEAASGVKAESRRLGWTFHRAYNEGFWLRSYEKAILKKIGIAPWHFTSFVHLSAAPVGMVVGREIEIVMIDTEATHTASDAKISLWYKIHRIGTGFGTTAPYYSSDFEKDKVFYANK